MVLTLLKAYGIKRVIVSPGTINLALVASMMQDSWFEMYSCVDECSAAYMACGLAAETKEPVVLSCTGATASRNYVPAMTEAFYRKLPVIAITSAKNKRMLGHLTQQIIDRTQQLNDIVKLSVHIPLVDDKEAMWQCNMDVNKALTECRRHGGGPVHINLEVRDLSRFDVKELPVPKMIHYIGRTCTEYPVLPCGRIIVYVGSHIALDIE
jgi:2-succinyl-5-enolpyruvyl-6-hydroxy-3-cyclohexene-1-carboxylate synthase